MLSKTIDFFSGLKMTIIAGVFLVFSLVLLLTKTASPLDPAWLTVVICGFPLLYYAIWRVIYNEGITKISSALLISIAMAASIYIGELFAAGEVAFIMAIGGILEGKTAEKARKGLKKLISLAPEQGRVIRNGKDEMINIELVKMGDTLRVLPGEAVPVDGEILSGDTSIDQSIITGESLPIDKTAGDSVFCGTINRFGSIDIKATKVGKDSSLQKLIRLVEEAETNKAPIQRIIDKWAGWLVPLALLIAVVTYLITRDTIRAVTVLVVFCPCALALATPTSIMAAIGQASKHGVIIKSGDALERMGKVNTIAFDKTGTLTHGNLVVSDVVSFCTELNESGILQLAASAEAHSEHPLGKAIAACAREKEIAIKPVKDFKMIPGKGISAEMDGSRIHCGNSAYLNENGISLDDGMIASLEGFRRQGKAVILVSSGDKCKGLVALSDTLRPAAKSMVSELKQTQTDAVLLTGDNRQTAQYFAEQAGIEFIHAELLPAQKVEKIQELQKAGRSVCMIGDGVNDAPALKTADVGVAMGSMGSDIAIEASDIALMGDDIAKIPYLKRLSNATVKLIKFNISIAMLINFVAIVLSVLAVLNPISGALVHNGGSILVILNAAFLYDRKYI